MIKTKKFLRNERGFMLLHVVFLTLITSFAAIILFNAAPRMKNPQSVLRLTALHLLNEKFALIESSASRGILDLSAEERTTKNFSEKVPIILNVTASEKSSDGNLHFVTVRVEWTVDGQKSFLEQERTIRLE